MQTYLADLQPQLKQATIDTDALLVKISEDRKIANEQSILVEAEAVKCNMQANEAKTLKDSCEVDLAEALPGNFLNACLFNKLFKSFFNSITGS